MARYLVTTAEEAINWEGKQRGVERVLRNVKNLLLLRMGEIPYDRYRGLDAAISDLPKADLERVLLIEVDRALLWEEDAEAVSAEAVMQEDGSVVLQVVIETDAEAV